MNDHDMIAAYLAAHKPSTGEPDWGDLQEVYRTLRAHGYVLARHRGGGLLVCGHSMSEERVRALADRLRTGQMWWQS